MASEHARDGTEGLGMRGSYHWVQEVSAKMMVWSRTNFASWFAGDCLPESQRAAGASGVDEFVDLVHEKKYETRSGSCARFLGLGEGQKGAAQTCGVTGI